MTQFARNESMRWKRLHSCNINIEKGSRMRKRSNKSLLLGASAATLALLAACSAPETDGATSPQSEGDSNQLAIACSQQEDFCQAITKAFSDETGIETTYVRLGAGEVLARLDTTPGEFDVWSGGQAENHLLANDRGHVELYVSEDAAALPEKYNDETGIWSGFYTDSVAFCSNEKELANLGVEAPTSWDDLLNPELEGNVAMPHPATAGVGYMAIYTLSVLNGGDEDATVDYFKNLNTNVLQYSKNAGTGVEQAGRGEVAVSIALDSDCEKGIQEGFDELVTTYPEEGTGYEVGAVSVLANARNVDAAKQYMDWLLTPAAQDLYGDIPSFAAPTHPDAILGENVPRQDTVNQVEWDVREAADKRDGYVSKFDTEIASESEAQ